MYCHIDLQATTTEIRSYIICQSYWKMYHSQSTNVAFMHNGAPAYVSRAV
jgi:hypothetical protein